MAIPSPFSELMWDSTGEEGSVGSRTSGIKTVEGVGDIHKEWGCVDWEEDANDRAEMEDVSPVRSRSSVMLRGGIWSDSDAPAFFDSVASCDSRSLLSSE